MVFFFVVLPEAFLLELLPVVVFFFLEAADDFDVDVFFVVPVELLDDFFVVAIIVC